MKTLIFLLMPLFSIGQKWYSINWNDVAIIAAQSIAGGADAVNERIVHKGLGRGNQFWDYKISFKNKYKDWPNDMRAKFPGSKTILVAFTDGYHLTRMVKNTGNLVTIAIVAGDFRAIPKKERWKYIAKKTALSLISNRLAFNLVYKN